MNALQDRDPGTDCDVKYESMHRGHRSLPTAGSENDIMDMNSTSFRNPDMHWCECTRNMKCRRDNRLKTWWRVVMVMVMGMGRGMEMEIEVL